MTDHTPTPAMLAAGERAWRETEAEAPDCWLALVWRAMNAALPEDPKAPPTDAVDIVIDQLDRRVMPDPTRQRLREAQDRADKPLAGRAGADKGLVDTAKRLRSR